MTAAGAKSEQRPTRKRYGVAAMGFALSFITYLDRAAIGPAAPAILKDLQLSPVQMGYVFSAFGLAYAAFELPSAGWATGWARAGCCCGSYCGGRFSPLRRAGHGTTDLWW